MWPERRQDRRAEPLPPAADRVGAPVVDPRRDHLDRPGTGVHLPRRGVTVAHHQPPGPAHHARRPARPDRRRPRPPTRRPASAAHPPERCHPAARRPRVAARPRRLQSAPGVPSRPTRQRRPCSRPTRSSGRYAPSRRSTGIEHSSLRHWIASPWIRRRVSAGGQRYFELGSPLLSLSAPR